MKSGLAPPRLPDPPVRPSRARPTLFSGFKGAIFLVGLLGLLALPSITGSSPGPLLTGNPTPPTLVVWTSGKLPSGLADATGKLSGVQAVTIVRGGTLWLSAWSAGDGGAVSTPPGGYLYPVDVAAIEPLQYRAFVPPGSKDAFGGLAAGGALLSKTGAGFRGITTTGSLKIGRTTLPVKGVVDDYLARAHEVVVSYATGASIGAVTPKYLLVALRPGVSAKHVEGEIGRLVTRGLVRIRTASASGVLRYRDAVLSLARVKSLFGELPAKPGKGSTLNIDPAWIDSHTASVSLPLLGTTRCNKSIIPQLSGALSEVQARGLGALIPRRNFGGCFSPRLVRSGQEVGISRHAWGIAFDINVSRNPYGHKPSMDPRLIAVFERWGFTWGGRWLVPDGMHFEFLHQPAKA
jgi:hypothetical protein